MANQQGLDLLKQGVEVWNQWRVEHPEIPGIHFDNRPDLSKTELSGIDLSDADLSWVNLEESNLCRVKLLRADLTEAFLMRANLGEANMLGVLGLRSDLRGADLKTANLSLADLAEADLSEADLRTANLWRADLSSACLRRANLSGANLSWANLSQADFSGANLAGCFVYATSTWNVKLNGTIQSNLIITEPHKIGESVITVDNLEMAQFIYLLLDNQHMHHIINTITSKMVLVLGRFTPKRKAVLDAIRHELRKHNYLPVVFDFKKRKS